MKRVEEMKKNQTKNRVLLLMATFTLVNQVYGNGFSKQANDIGLDYQKELQQNIDDPFKISFYYTPVATLKASEIFPNIEYLRVKPEDLVVDEDHFYLNYFKPNNYAGNANGLLSFKDCRNIKYQDFKNAFAVCDGGMLTKLDYSDPHKALQTENILDIDEIFKQIEFNVTNIIDYDVSNPDYIYILANITEDKVLPRVISYDIQANKFQGRRSNSFTFVDIFGSEIICSYRYDVAAFFNFYSAKTNINKEYFPKPTDFNLKSNEFMVYIDAIQFMRDKKTVIFLTRVRVTDENNYQTVVYRSYICKYSINADTVDFSFDKSCYEQIKTKRLINSSLFKIFELEDHSNPSKFIKQIYLFDDSTFGVFLCLLGDDYQIMDSTCITRTNYNLSPYFAAKWEPGLFKAVSFQNQNGGISLIIDISEKVNGGAILLYGLENKSNSLMAIKTLKDAIYTPNMMLIFEQGGRYKWYTKSEHADFILEIKMPFVEVNATISGNIQFKFEGTTHQRQVIAETHQSSFFNITFPEHSEIPTSYVYQKMSDNYFKLPYNFMRGNQLRLSMQIGGLEVQNLQKGDIKLGNIGIKGTQESFSCSDTLIIFDGVHKNNKTQRIIQKAKGIPIWDNKESPVEFNPEIDRESIFNVSFSKPDKYNKKNEIITKLCSSSSTDNHKMNEEYAYFSILNKNQSKMILFQFEEQNNKQYFVDISVSYDSVSMIMAGAKYDQMASSRQEVLVFLISKTKKSIDYFYFNDLKATNNKNLIIYNIDSLQLGFNAQNKELFCPTKIIVSPHDQRLFYVLNHCEHDKTASVIKFNIPGIDKTLKLDIKYQETIDISGRYFSLDSGDNFGFDFLTTGEQLFAIQKGDSYKFNYGYGMSASPSLDIQNFDWLSLGYSVKQIDRIDTLLGRNIVLIQTLSIVGKIQYFILRANSQHDSRFTLVAFHEYMNQRLTPTLIPSTLNKNVVYVFDGVSKTQMIYLDGFHGMIDKNKIVDPSKNMILSTYNGYKMISKEYKDIIKYEFKPKNVTVIPSKIKEMKIKFIENETIMIDNNQFNGDISMTKWIIDKSIQKEVKGIPRLQKISNTKLSKLRNDDINSEFKDFKSVRIDDSHILVHYNQDNKTTVDIYGSKNDKILVSAKYKSNCTHFAASKLGNQIFIAFSCYNGLDTNINFDSVSLNDQTKTLKELFTLGSLHFQISQIKMNSLEQNSTSFTLGLISNQISQLLLYQIDFKTKMIKEKGFIKGNFNNVQMLKNLRGGIHMLTTKYGHSQIKVNEISLDGDFINGEYDLKASETKFNIFVHKLVCSNWYCAITDDINSLLYFKVEKDLKSLKLTRTKSRLFRQNSRYSKIVDLWVESNLLISRSRKPFNQMDSLSEKLTLYSVDYT